MKKKTWKNKLTKKELQHVKDTTIGCTLWEFKKNREWHRKQENEPCFECRLIALKLKLED